MTDGARSGHIVWQGKTRIDRERLKEDCSPARTWCTDVYTVHDQSAVPEELERIHHRLAL
jgi:hypothetical protein